MFTTTIGVMVIGITIGTETIGAGTIFTALIGVGDGIVGMVLVGD